MSAKPTTSPETKLQAVKRSLAISQRVVSSAILDARKRKRKGASKTTTKKTTKRRTTKRK